MRFTRQLTACVCVVILTSAPLRGATPAENVEAYARQMGVFESGIAAALLISAQSTENQEAVIIDGVTSAVSGCPAPCTPAKYMPPFNLFGNATGNSGSRNGTYETALALTPPGRSIQGIDYNGNTRTLYCNPENCTPGSLNRHAINSGAKMMVPANLYEAALAFFEVDKMGEEGKEYREHLWLMLAATSWSDEWAQLDTNSMSAYTRQQNNPGAYAISQATLDRMLDGEEVGDLVLGALNEEVAAAAEKLGDLGTAIFTNTDEKIVTIDVLVIDNTIARAPDVTIFVSGGAAGDTFVSPSEGETEAPGCFGGLDAAGDPC